MISWPSSGIDDGYMWLALVGKSVGGEGVEGGGRTEDGKGLPHICLSGTYVIEFSFQIR